MLWLITSGAAAITRCRSSIRPRKSGISTSITVRERCRISWITCANTVLPPSFKSSRATDVITVWRGGALPEPRPLLGARHRRDHDPGRALHAPVRVLRGGAGEAERLGGLGRAARPAVA